MAVAEAGPPAHPWIAGARPRTLPAAVVPVLVGTAAASPHVVAWRAVAALVVALAFQVGVNFANDYSDGVRGTDADRIGPVRLVASGLASPERVKLAAVASLAIACAAGSALALAVDWRLFAIGAASALAAWGYTGGPRPYGYAGMGELFVFVFFGLVATCGSAYVELHRVPPVAAVCAIPVGLLAVALLAANNLRDLPKDAVAGKRTLAVMLGERRARVMLAGCLALPFPLAAAVAVWHPLALVALASLPLAVRPLTSVLEGRRGAEMVAVLGATARLQLAYGLALAVGLLL